MVLISLFCILFIKTSRPAMSASRIVASCSKVIERFFGPEARVYIGCASLLGDNEMFISGTTLSLQFSRKPVTAIGCGYSRQSFRVAPAKVVFWNCQSGWGNVLTTWEQSRRWWKTRRSCLCEPLSWSGVHCLGQGLHSFFSDLLHRTN